MVRLRQGAWRTKAKAEGGFAGVRMPNAQPLSGKEACNETRSEASGETCKDAAVVAPNAPHWHRQALQRDIDFIVLVYCKAEGFVFCPKNLARPFRVGGDYGGNFEANAQQALDHYQRYFNRAFAQQVDWFIPYVHKVLHGVNFGLDALQIERRQLKTIRGRWPW